MGDNSDQTDTKLATIHLVYTVTNIQNKICVLDGVKVSYSTWVKLFQLHARGYDVLNHIDGSPAPATTDAAYSSWMKIDAVVLQWIYGTLSDDYLLRVLATESTAYEAWNQVKDLFLNNKASRAAALEHEFTNLSLKAMPSLDAYCQRLKELTDQLDDVDCPINDKRCVLQLVCGLPPEYDNVASYLNQTLPSWENACSMLQLELQRQSARESIAPTPLLATVTNDSHVSPPNRDTHPQNRNTNPPQSHRPPLNRRETNRREPNHNNRPYRGQGQPQPRAPYPLPVLGLATVLGPTALPLPDSK